MMNEGETKNYGKAICLKMTCKLNFPTLATFYFILSILSESDYNCTNNNNYNYREDSNYQLRNV